MLHIEQKVIIIYCVYNSLDKVKVGQCGNNLLFGPTHYAHKFLVLEHLFETVNIRLEFCCRFGIRSMVTIDNYSLGYISFKV